MSEVIKRFIGKDCVISTMNETVLGVVESVDDNWIVISPLDKTGSSEVINIDYISRIREYPKNKKGKRKTFVG